MGLRWETARGPRSLDHKTDEEQKQYAAETRILCILYDEF